MLLKVRVVEVASRLDLRLPDQVKKLEAAQTNVNPDLDLKQARFPPQGERKA